MEKKMLVSTEPAGSLVVASLPMTLLKQEPASEAVPMTLFGEILPK
jgi:hypothetical protein